MIAKLKFLLWSAAHLPGADKTCVGCGSRRTYLVRRKYTTALYGCHACKLMFRIPKDELGMGGRYYDSEYKQGFTTECPSAEALEELKRAEFAGTEKDYATYIEVLQAVGIVPGMRILDFGCSWGYGSWQLARAGYEVYSYEIGRGRAQYAQEKLGCTIVSPKDFKIDLDCFFSAHVLEHLNNPAQMWSIAYQLLKPTGVAIVFVPNGSLLRPRVHRLWGKVHPLLISPEALLHMAKSQGFFGLTYTSPYDVEEIRHSEQTVRLGGSEVMIVARKTS